MYQVIQSGEASAFRGVLDKTNDYPQAGFLKVLQHLSPFSSPTFNQ